MQKGEAEATGESKSWQLNRVIVHVGDLRAKLNLKGLIVVVLNVREIDQTCTSLTLFKCLAWKVKTEIFAALFLFSNIQYIFYFNVKREKDSRMKTNDVSLPKLINVALVAGMKKCPKTDKHEHAYVPIFLFFFFQN